ncbi:non-hydrolyzing UDP-N-acetylglucosamine 2-epimerase [Natronobacterium gregoryi]|uniref:UDP-N-acetylglucosamine 2-epimerase n=2 Tax=Natronobacterium gregoryi TaxID=44930 RepID=L0ACE0_NATGS|nr:UDP-N-acetylglucosamine 2-epimerase (non-hydrolyzing) [Natronobacterium gregoryi]AFZ71531.1 UDP-N-acetylglucosamine 2-epimerase [Natronobacterium gregoryi SP2]ELY66587.1 UDP-N-acetylglucosamine 2-epimerase [Natronobacterium gregoryi SP2]PLK21303.1 UDP-N-acetylglucosamine 2-epimerase (non-hydrolyzing) [Natronobacterium gregoryi SP2]SFI82703.1 UDP-N-acetylglucosamine 2-epimerase (non-hydrolysing) [Natronobacterium gregoryi]
MRICSVVGARPQFVKAAVVSQKIRDVGEEVLVHTGQHYDEELSDVFFEELDIPEPEYNLGVASDTHARQTAAMLTRLESVLESVQPDAVLLYGDTNSTLAGAIVGSKRDATVAHVEAGLRSGNREMPEEINRVLTDHVSDLCFAPSEAAVENLATEGISEGVFWTGDVMYDALLEARNQSTGASSILAELGLREGEFVLATVHRQRNTDARSNLASIVDALADVPLPVVFPAHPRTVDRLRAYGLWERATAELEVIEPLGYLDFVRLLDAAERIATDSGGVQKEAFFLETRCVTLRTETEWEETVDAGWNRLVGSNADQIREALVADWTPDSHPRPYGDGLASRRIVSLLQRELDGSDPDRRLEAAPLD